MTRSQRLEEAKIMEKFRMNPDFMTWTTFYDEMDDTGSNDLTAEAKEFLL